MNNEITRIPSGFPMLDILTGGYPEKGLVIARYLGHEMQAEILQEFMERQALNLALKESPQSRKTLLCSLQMSTEETAKDIGMNFARSDKDRKELLQSRLFITGQEKDEAIPTSEVFLKNISRHIRKNKFQALIIDAIDTLFPREHGNGAISKAINEGFRDIESKNILAGLERIRTEFRIPVIVTDYGNKLITTPREKDVIEIELVEDINGTTQANVSIGTELIKVEDLFGIPQHVGTELIRYAISHYDRYLRFPESTDRIQALANAGAAIAMQIDDLYKTIQQ